MVHHEKGENQPNESETLVENDGRNMALFEDEIDERPMVTGVLGRLANYQGGIMPTVTEEEVAALKDPEAATKQAKPAAKLGTVLGVYFPCIQNIFGVILFVRMTWLVGNAGILEGFSLVFMCCCTTLTTAISMSAVATNGVITGGGSYFMISRALGPEFGGAVGILFYLGTSVASSMYIVGAVEIFLNYMVPQASIFGPLTDQTNAFNNYRVYGTILLLLMFVCVFIGVKFVSKFSPIALFCVIVSITAIYVGIFTANPESGPKVCMLGNRILAEQYILDDNNTIACHKNDTGPIYKNYCGGNITDPMSDPDCVYLMENEVKLIAGIPGLAANKFSENIWSSYQEAGERVGEQGSVAARDKGEIAADIATSFVILLAIFFPSCTGIMAGSNRSGDLQDAQKSIPVGTIAAILTTSFVYLSCVIFFGSVAEGQLLRDKFGESMGGGLLCARLVWPNMWVMLVGSLLSTIGAGLQSLTGAPRLLQAIASDGIIPFLNPFSVTTKGGEPLRALFITTFISQLGVLVASLDYIAPIITM